MSGTKARQDRIAKAICAARQLRGEDHHSHYRGPTPCYGCAKDAEDFIAAFEAAYAAYTEAETP